MPSPSSPTQVDDSWSRGGTSPTCTNLRYTWDGSKYTWPEKGMPQSARNLGADFVMVVVPNDNSGTLGSAFVSHWASAVQRGELTGITFVHELVRGGWRLVV